MSGHSKWKNIQHRKGAQDARRGKAFTKIIKEITVSVKTGSPDPDSNPRLRSAIQAARQVNMPRDNIERAIKKAAGADSDNYVETTFEAYGNDGVALFIECATDNNTRTVSNIKSYFNKYGGSLGKDGCLQFIFTRKGIFVLNKGSLDEEEFTLEMIDAGAEDVEFEEDLVTIETAMEDFGAVQKKLAEMKLEPIESGLQRIPNETKQLSADSFQKFMKLLNVIEEDDDVQKVYHNVEYNEELVNSLE